MAKCPKCKIELKGGETFCTECGTPLFYCDKCGEAYTLGDAFCSGCGNKLPQAEVREEVKEIVQEPVKVVETVQPVKPVQQVPRATEGSKGTSNKLLAGVLIIALAAGGFYYHQQNVVIPREKAAAAAKAVEEQKAKETAELAAAKAEINKDLDVLNEKIKIKNEFDSRLAAAANTINSNKPYSAYDSLKELRDEIDKEYNNIPKLKVSEKSKAAVGYLKDTFYYERLRAIGMLRGIRGDGAGYSDGGDAYDKYHEANTKLEQEIAKLSQ